MLLRGSPVRIFPHRGFWLDIGRVEDFQKAQDLAGEDTPPAFEVAAFRGQLSAVALEPAAAA
jgi:mannose-1-phosphate guanylyltransferase